MKQQLKFSKILKLGRHDINTLIFVLKKVIKFRSKIVLVGMTPFEDYRAGTTINGYGVLN